MYPNITVPEGLALELFNAVEVHPVAEYPEGFCEQVEDSDIGSDELALYFWSVYLHYDHEHPDNQGFGGLECVADLPSKEAAEAYAEGLEKALSEVVGPRLIKVFTV